MIDYSSKKIAFYAGLCILFLLLTARLFYLQVYKSKRYLSYSEKNRVRRYVLQPHRGLIFDRQGEMLVDNYPAYALSAIPFECTQSDSCLSVLAGILQSSEDSLKARMQSAENPFIPIRLDRDLDYDRLVQIEERRLELPGVVYDIEPRRDYPGMIRAPHILGYIGEATQAELVARKQEGLRLGDLVGKTGIEKVYDELLRGKVGYDFVEVDAFGREVKDIKVASEKPAQRGADIYLSIDHRLQQQTEALFANSSGGAALVDVTNGEVLVLCSKPDYDPNLFSKIVTHDAWQRIINNEEKPLYDRMIKSIYPPGSTFKLILAAAALETNAITLSHSVYCPGFYRLGRRFFDCWKPEGHGTMDLSSAIQHSCNTYFYDISLKVDVDVWADMAKKFGFGKKTGIDLVGENSGLVPDRNYMNKVYGENKWTKGMILNLGIGQGDILTTPIQMAQFAMIIANKGTWYQLHLLHKVYDPGNGRTIQSQPIVKTLSGVSEKTFDIIRRGMYKVVNEEGGTGLASNCAPVHVAGKTGTAQNPHGDSHAWFIGFAPFEAPQIAICVFVENGGSGGTVAAPIARRMIKRYFELYSDK